MHVFADHPLALPALAWGLAALAQAFAWAWQRAHRNAGIVDVVWAFGVGGAALLFAALGDGAPLPRMLLAVLGGAWDCGWDCNLFQPCAAKPRTVVRAVARGLAGRPSKWFVFFRRKALLVVCSRCRTWRRAQTRATWDRRGWWRHRGHSSPVSPGSRSPMPSSRASGRSGQQGAHLPHGTWRYSRHPNTSSNGCRFAVRVVAVGSPWHWLAWTGPVVIMYSSLPQRRCLHRAQALRTRGEDYRAYMRETAAPMFFPWFPKPPRQRRPERAEHRRRPFRPAHDAPARGGLLGLAERGACRCIVPGHRGCSRSGCARNAWAGRTGRNGAAAALGMLRSSPVAVHVRCREPPALRTAGRFFRACPRAAP